MNLPRDHRLVPSYDRLEGQRCVCGAVQFPPRPVCRACGGADLAPHRLTGRGKVFSWPEAAQPAAGFSSPYLVAAVVELEEGIRITAQLTDLEPEEIEIGLPVVMVTRRIQERGEEEYLVYGYKFRPVIDPVGRAYTLADAAP